MAGIGMASIIRLMDEKCNELSGNLLKIIELLVDQKDTRYGSARSQILDIMGGFKREVIEELKDGYDIISHHHETIVVKGQVR